MSNPIKRVSLASTARLFAVTVSMLLFSSPASAEIIKCKAITSIPTIITTQGIYCLKGNLEGSMASGNAITINTNNVTIDFNGFKLGNLAAGAGTNAIGVRASGRKNITLRNGIIRGFKFGIALDSSNNSGHLVEGMRMDGNTIQGIAVYGKGAVVRNNQVISTGGATGSPHAYGILVSSGDGASIIGNNVADTIEGSGGSSFAIYCSNCNGTAVEGNQISNSAAGPGTSYGIYFTGGDGNFAVANGILNNLDNGIFYTGSTGMYRDNRTSGVTTTYTGGTDAGNND